jgi:hypothetical protein
MRMEEAERRDGGRLKDIRAFIDSLYGVSVCIGLEPVSLLGLGQLITNCHLSVFRHH